MAYIATMNIFILCIETSGPQCTVAIGHNGDCISEVQSSSQWQHSQYLTIYIQEALAEAKISIYQLSAVAISGGPGSYTGLRVGAASAKGICYAKEIPLISVDTLKIIAYPQVDRLDDKHKVILSTIDARRDEVYYNIYNEQLESQVKTTSHIVTEDSFSDVISEGVIICGDGADKIQEIMSSSLSNDSIILSTLPAAINMAQLSYESYQEKKYEDIAYYNPFYMKPPNITTRKKPLF